MIGSALSSVVVLLLVGGFCAYYYFVVYKRMTSPEARAAAFAAAGYRPGEAVQVSFGGNLLAPGDYLNQIIEWRRGNGPVFVFANITTHDRLHFTIGIGAEAQNIMFEPHAPPSIRVLGRVFTQDATGIGDVLMNQTTTNLFFVAEGNAPPPGAGRRMIYNQVGSQEASAIIEVAGHGHPAFVYETYDTAVGALLHWAHAHQAAAPMAQAQGYGPPPAGGFGR